MRAGTSIYDLHKFHFCVDVYLFLFGTFYVILVPYTKVEESFNMQASHDMLFYGYSDIHNYDHNEFPGVVPRTFIGPLLLSLMVHPFKFMMQTIFPLIFSSFNIKMICQYLIRISLLCINIGSLSYFRKSFIAMYIVPHYTITTKQKINQTITLIKVISTVFAILICAQFHCLFYQSRLLPNCFALPLVTIAFGFYFRKKYHLSLQCLAASTIIFRCDTIVIAFPFIIIMLFRVSKESKFIKGRCRTVLIQFIFDGLIASVFCILLSIVIDSWFWSGYQSLTWPEFQVFIYNTVQNKSCNWGTSPWNEYFTKHLIKMLLVNIVFIPLSVVKSNPLLFVLELRKKHTSFGQLCEEFLDFESIQLASICFIFIFLYSFLPHKETRFIFFVIPPFTLLSTIGCIRLWTFWGFKHIDFSQFTLEYYRKNLKKKQSQCYFMYISSDNKKRRCSMSSVILTLVIIAIFLSYIVVFLGVWESSYNYCGGTAITTFERIVRPNQTVSCYNYNNILNANIHMDDMKCVHIGNKAAMSGAIRFTVPSYCNDLRFDKTENLSKEDYAQQIDPCHLMEEICAKTQNNNNNACQLQHKSGYDYLITQFESIPEYQLVPNGIIYAKSESLTIFKYIKQLILSSDSTNNQFAQPALYILKRK